MVSTVKGAKNYNEHHVITFIACSFILIYIISIIFSECLWCKNSNPSHIDKLAWDCFRRSSLGLWTSFSWPYYVTVGDIKDIVAIIWCVSYTTSSSSAYGTPPWTCRCCNLLRQTLFYIFLPYKITSMDIFWWCYSSWSWA